MPGEEDDAHIGALPPRGKQRVKGGQVIRLFVEMNDIGPRAREDFANRWIVVKMLAAIEAQRRDEKLIVTDVFSFELKHPALIFP